MNELDPELYNSLPAFSPSQVDVWEECPQEWEYAYVERLKRKASGGRHLDVGNYFHELSHVLFQMIQAGQKPGSDFLRDYMDSRVKSDFTMILNSEYYDDAQKIHFAQIISQVNKMMRRYIRVQSPQIDLGMVPLEIEKHVEAIFITPKGRRVILHGFVDLIYRNRVGKLRLRDHKTGANRSSWHPKRVPLHGQLLDYAIIYKEMTGRQILDVEISYINSYDYKTKEPTREEAFGLYPHEHNEAAVSNARNNLLRVVDLMLDREPYRRLSADCASCSYFDLCDRELRGFSSVDLKRTNYEKVSRDYEFKHSKIGEAAFTEKDSDGGSEAGPKGNNFILRWNGIRASS